MLEPAPITVNNAGTNVVLSWPSTMGQTYQLEFTDDLASGNWTALGPPLIGDSTALSLTNTAAQGGQRFFRLRLGF